jgi:hypothetical protein
MAQVLAIVPEAGLDAVLVAVELALESAPPSGRVSVEHVRNVLARLNAYFSDRSRPVQFDRSRRFSLIVVDEGVRK